MALAFGEKIVSKAYFGGKTVSAIYLGTKKVFPEEEESPVSGDIRLRIRTTSANQIFQLFYQITTEEGGYISVDWGDGNTETFTGKTTYQPTHTYAAAGEYIVKLAGSKFTGVEGKYISIEDFTAAVREILSLKMPTDSTNVSLRYAFYECTNLTGSIPEWDDCITSTHATYYNCTGLSGNIPEWGEKITTASNTYYNCTGLSGNIPEWGEKITNATFTYWGCTGLTGNIPEWGEKITNASYTYSRCAGLTGNIPAWGANITDASYTYSRCTGLTGNIPAWGANITDASFTYLNCTGLTGCSEELLQDPMPSRITEHPGCVSGCVDEIRKHFTPDWGGTKAVEYIPGTGDIRLRIQTTTANQSFPLFNGITTESGGFVSVDWGDGKTETLTGKTRYQLEHTYATAGEYIIKLTGSKFTRVNGISLSYDDFRNAVREILSLKMPTDSTSVSLDSAFYECTNLTGSIPEWDDCITRADATYYNCTGLSGNIPAWGAKITTASNTYEGCTGLTGSIPAWGASITNAQYTYRRCSGLTGNIPEWGANITNAGYTYHGCRNLTGNIPEWGVNITEVSYTYNGCTGLTSCSKELLQDPMPSRITSHTNCVSGCADAIRQHFTPDWGGDAEMDDIRLRIETTSANQLFPLFSQIDTEEGGYISVDWGDGNKETFTGATSYQPIHYYTTAGEYIVKLTGSKFTRVAGPDGRDDSVGSIINYYKDAVREILSLKMPKDSTSVSLDATFRLCEKLVGGIPEWEACITDLNATYAGCRRLSGNIPEWGANIVRAWGVYQSCEGLTGSIPKWGPKITDTTMTYRNCSRLTRCSDELLQDPMPSRIKEYRDCVGGCVDAIRQHFTERWGGTK